MEKLWWVVLYLFLLVVCFAFNYGANQNDEVDDA